MENEKRKMTAKEMASTMTVKDMIENILSAAQCGTVTEVESLTELILTGIKAIGYRITKEPEGGIDPFNGLTVTEALVTVYDLSQQNDKLKARVKELEGFLSPFKDLKGDL